jgi:pimeloyl-[acyl-carrier protein] methyl ester esterase
MLLLWPAPSLTLAVPWGLSDMPQLTTDNGISLHYETAGSGPPLVFLHGWLMSGRVWHYQQQLADRFRVITIDLRGHGSSAPGGDFSLDSLAGDLDELFAALQLDAATLIGWSMGAQLALHASSMLKNRLEAVVLIGGTPCFCVKPDYPHGLAAVEARGMGLRLKRNMTVTAGEFFKGMFAAGEVTPAQFRDIAAHTVAKLPEMSSALAALETLANADLRPVLPAITLPVLLVHGTADTICLPGASQFMAEQLPHAELHLLDGLGHAPFLSRSEQFNTILQRFLDGVYVRH